MYVFGAEEKGSFNQTAGRSEAADAHTDTKGIVAVIQGGNYYGSTTQSYSYEL